MFEIRDGVVNFIVIDFDMATMVDPDGEPLAAPSAKHRTGTLPFMAYELLKDMSQFGSPERKRVVHRLRHDFESLFYLCLYCLFTMVEIDDEKMKATLAAQVAEWENSTLKSIASIKQLLCTSDEAIEELIFPNSCEALRQWFVGWVDVFSDAYSALAGYKKKTRLAKRLKQKGPPDFDIDTLQGTLTRDKIKESLRLSYDRPLRSEDLQLANISGLDKIIGSYMHDAEDGQDGVAAEQAKPCRKPKNTTKTKKSEVVKKKTSRDVAASKKATTSTAKLVSPIRQQIPKQATPKRGVRTLAAATRNMTTRSMRKGAGSNPRVI